MIGREVRFRTTPDGLVLDASGDLAGTVIDVGVGTVTIHGEQLGCVVLPLTALEDLQDVTEDAGGGAGGSAAGQ